MNPALLQMGNESTGSFSWIWEKPESEVLQEEVGQGAQSTSWPKRVRATGIRGIEDSLVTLWSVVHQVPLSMGFPGENTGRGLPFLSLGDLPKPGIKAVSPSPLSQADSLPNEPSGKPRYIDRDMLNSAIPSPWIQLDPKD